MLYHITFALRRGGEMGSSKYELMRTMGRGGVTSKRTFAYKFFLIKHPVPGNCGLFVSLICLLGRFLVMVITRGIFRTQSTMLTTYIRYPLTNF